MWLDSDFLTVPKSKDCLQGRIREFVQGGLKFCIFPGARGAQHPLRPENPLKAIDFSGPGGA